MAVLEMKTTTTFETIECGQCGVVFALPVRFIQEKRETHKGWYCPNGHCRVFLAETTEEKLKKELDRAQRATAETREILARERTAHASTKGQLTKVKNRIEKGVCPQCNRHFVNVERHMGTQHGGKL